MKFDLMLAVNDENGNVTDTCEQIEISADGSTLMTFDDLELPFLEIPNDLIQIGNNVLHYTARGTMVGNVFWNSYAVSPEDAVLLVNYLGTFASNLVEAVEPLFTMWADCNELSIADFEAALSE